MSETIKRLLEQFRESHVMVAKNVSNHEDTIAELRDRMDALENRLNRHDGQCDEILHAIINTLWGKCDCDPKTAVVTIGGSEDENAHSN